mmetsp:Transcript_14299/g.30582  ORF Transcript_14299/g.30582 Transcript_14299/m.30582 type:complete len:219 (+) Transcript_14299:306-962(+)
MRHGCQQSGEVGGATRREIQSRPRCCLRCKVPGPRRFGLQRKVRAAQGGRGPDPSRGQRLLQGRRLRLRVRHRDSQEGGGGSGRILQEEGGCRRGRRGCLRQVNVLRFSSFHQQRARDYHALRIQAGTDAAAPLGLPAQAHRAGRERPPHSRRSCSPRFMPACRLNGERSLHLMVQAPRSASWALRAAGAAALGVATDRSSPGGGHGHGQGRTAGSGV